MKYPMSGDIINGPTGDKKLQLQEPLGNGAFGIVYRAKETETGEIFAVKFPQFAGFGGHSELVAFFNEVQAAQLINHPNVVKILYVETETKDTIPYITMEYIEDGTLKSRLDKYKSDNKLVELERLFLWTNELVDGMAAINDKMLHRDIKADNVMMQGDIIKISDFGLSKVIGALTRTNTFKGGQHMFYMAPEGWRMETNKIQLDMYAVGILLYEIATLNYPYSIPQNPSDIIAIQNMHLYQTAKPVKEYRDDLPTNFIPIIARLMEKRPEDRFDTWLDVKEALNKVNISSLKTEGTRSSLLISSLAEMSEQVHDLQMKKKAEEDRKLNEEKERKAMEEYQQKKLMEIIESVVAEYNEYSNNGNIHRVYSSVCDYSYKIPNAGTINIDFFPLENHFMKLKLGEVRYVGYAKDDDGGGFNYLLCRTDESDMYGRWVICYIEQSLFADPLKLPPRKATPFCFTHLGDITEIERADHAMHVYTVYYEEGEDNIKKSFLRLALEMLKRNNNIKCK